MDRTDADPRTDALVLRLRAAGCVFAEDEAGVLLGAASSADQLEAMAARRVAGEPLEVVVGFADFCGVRVQVDPGVFVPRARTWLMVERAAEHLRGRSDPMLVDLCCGTGAIGLAVSTRIPDLALVASELDPAAVACARRNVEPVGGLVVAGDLFDGLPDPLRGRIQVITCNAPYVPTTAIASMPPEARDHEHRVALDGGPDGLDVVRRAIDQAPGWLAPGGLLVVEVGREQVAPALAHARAAGLQARHRSDDESGGSVVEADAASSRRCRNRSRLSIGSRDSAQVVVTTESASEGTRATTSGTARSGTGRPPTTEQVSRTADGGSPSDRPSP